MNVEETVIRIIAQENHLDPNTVTLDSTFAELGIDSLDGVNILFCARNRDADHDPRCDRQKHGQRPAGRGQLDTGNRRQGHFGPGCASAAGPGLC